MRSIRAFWASCGPRILKKGVVFFLDYDGTLSPIVRDPSTAHLSPRVLAVLKKIHKKTAARLAVISGRDIQTLKKFLPLPGLILGGNHGAVIQGPGLRFTHPGARSFRKELPVFERQVRKALSAFSGIRYEDKVYGFTVHYRALSPAQTRQASRILKRVLNSGLAGGKFRICRGKKVWELRPSVSWGKGDAVLWLLKKFERSGSRPFAVYIGDDVTDEDAFRVLGKNGAGIRVASHPSQGSAASFYLKSWKEVAGFLEKCSSLPALQRNDR